MEANDDVTPEPSRDARPSDPSGADPVAPRSRRGRIRAVLLGALTGLVVAYLGAAAYAAGRTPSSATVGGVDVSTMSQADALAAVQRAAKAAEDAPLVLVADEVEATFAPADLGLAVDAAASVAGLTGFTLDPVALWEHLAGTVERPLSVTTDNEALEAAVADFADQVDRDPVEGAVAITDGELAVTEAVIGLRVDADATRDAVTQAWPTASVEAVLERSAPQVGADAVAAARQVATTALAGPLTVEVTMPDGDPLTFEVPAPDLAGTLSFTPAAGALAPTFDEEALLDAVVDAGRSAEVLQDPRNATATFSGTTPTVVPHRTGVALQADSVAAPVEAALTGDDRVAVVVGEVTEPELTTEKIKATLPKELVSQFTTVYTGGTRWRNIEIAANRINGVYIAPGESFSMNGILGRRTPDKGYVKAGTIMNGALVDNYGGGISQVSTTIFNAAFFAGVQIDEYRAHSYYIPRYPEGREATVSWGTIDNRWTNDSPGGILVRAWANTGGMTVQFWGTKVYDIKATKSPRRNIVDPKTVKDNRPTCLPQSPMEGFDVTVQRIFYQGGREVKRQTYNTHYQPEVERICTHPDAQ